MVSRQEERKQPFNEPGVRMWQQGWKNDFMLTDGFDLRRLQKDHNAPAMRFPREMIRNLGWRKGALLWVTVVDNCLVIGKLEYRDPMEVASDKVDEVRRKFGVGGSKNDSTS